MERCQGGGVILRAPLEDELPALADLCFRSKAVWGYDAAFMEACRPVLRVDPDRARRGLARVAVLHDVLLGVVLEDGALDSHAAAPRSAFGGKRAAMASHASWHTAVG